MAKRSKIEKEIIKEIRKRGYKASHSYKINRKIYDIYLPQLNMLIEFNGDYWHCNPKKYDKNYFNKKRSLYAKDIWKRDAEKELLAKKEGFNFLVIWEADYKKKKSIIIRKIIQKNGRKTIHHPRKGYFNG